MAVKKAVTTDDVTTPKDTGSTTDDLSVEDLSDPVMLVDAEDVKYVTLVGPFGATKVPVELKHALLDSGYSVKK